MDRLEAVARIRQRAMHDGGQRIGEIALLERLAQRDFLHIAARRGNQLLAHAAWLARETAVNKDEQRRPCAGHAAPLMELVCPVVAAGRSPGADRAYLRERGRDPMDAHDRAHEAPAGIRQAKPARLEHVTQQEEAGHGKAVERDRPRRALPPAPARPGTPAAAGACRARDGPLRARLHVRSWARHRPAPRSSRWPHSFRDRGRSRARRATAARNAPCADRQAAHRASAPST